MNRLNLALVLTVVASVSNGCKHDPQAANKTDPPVLNKHGKRVDTSMVEGDPRFPVQWMTSSAMGWYAPIYHQTYISLRPAFNACNQNTERLQQSINEGDCSIILFDESRLSLEFVNFLSRSGPDDQRGNYCDANEAADRIVRNFGPQYFYKKVLPADRYPIIPLPDAGCAW